MWVIQRGGLGYDQVYVAGDIERAMEKERMQKGIPLVDAVQNDLKALAEKMDLTFNNYL